MIANSLPLFPPIIPFKSPKSSKIAFFIEKMGDFCPLTIPAQNIDDSCIYWRKQKSSINLWKNVWGEFPALLPLWKTKKQMMKTTTTYSPMTACRNPKVSARNVAEYLVVPNIMLPTNQPTYTSIIFWIWFHQMGRYAGRVRRLRCVLPFRVYIQ